MTVAPFIHCLPLNPGPLESGKAGKKAFGPRHAEGFLFERPSPLPKYSSLDKFLKGVDGFHRAIKLLTHTRSKAGPLCQ